MCLRFRNGAFDAIKSAAALSLIPLPLRAAVRLKILGCSCILNCHCKLVRTLSSEDRKHSRNHQTARFAKRWLFHKCQRFRRSWCTPRVLLPAMLTHPRQGAVQRSAGDKRSAGADLIASIALRRTRRTCARLPSFPRIKSQNPKGGFGALWHAFLLYLSSCNERWSPRRA